MDSQITNSDFRRVMIDAASEFTKGDCPFVDCVMNALERHESTLYSMTNSAIANGVVDRTVPEIILYLTGGVVGHGDTDHINSLRLHFHTELMGIRRRAASVLNMSEQCIAAVGSMPKKGSLLATDDERKRRRPSD